jgi:hypothetical protein
MEKVLREVVKEIERGDLGNLVDCVAPLREFSEPGLHVGEPWDIEDPSLATKTLEYLAGQLLDVVDRAGWFAMNSALCAIASHLDKLPPDSPSMANPC